MVGVRARQGCYLWQLTCMYQSLFNLAWTATGRVFASRCITICPSRPLARSEPLDGCRFLKTNSVGIPKLLLPIAVLLITKVDLMYTCIRHQMFSIFISFCIAKCFKNTELVRIERSSILFVFCWIL